MRHWDLFSEMDNMKREMDDIFRRMDYGRRSFDRPFFPELGYGDIPRINIAQDAENVYLSALLPGVKAEDLEMNVLKNTLTLTGERKDVAAEGAKKVFHRKERGAGKFLRTIELPYEVDAAEAVAELKNGILLVTLPKSEEAKPKRVLLKA
ncbi:MAG: Hsp20/alpha crystallin family protein [Desulfuromonadaceae bacterium]|nr:Hsp20/alpha crystallin family protein [Desulfuromonadaceae bacterium]